MVQFIYCPKSGNRVFAWKTHEEIASIEWRNGCRHVVGGCCLSYATACPGSWWRSDAKRMAEVIVRRSGGVAWDEQGQVSLVVPVRAAVHAAKLMDAAAPAFRQFPGEEWASIARRQEAMESARLANLARLVMAGWELPEEGESWPRMFSGGEIPRRGAACWSTKERRRNPNASEDEDWQQVCEVTLEWTIPGEPMPGGRTTTQTITVPASWGAPRIWGCSIVEHKEAAPTTTTITITRGDLETAGVPLSWAYSTLADRGIVLTDDQESVEIPLHWFDGACPEGLSVLRAAQTRIQLSRGY